MNGSGSCFSHLGKVIVIAVLANIAFAQVTWAQQRTATGFVVVDANKKVLGPVIGTYQGGNSPTVAVKVGKLWLPIAIARNGVLPTNAFYYASQDCSGQAYGDVTASPFPASVVRGSTLYGPSGPVITSFQLNSLSLGGSCIPSTYVTDVVALSAVLDLSKYTPPFTAVAVEHQDQNDVGDVKAAQ